jgi:hypothetical protein
MAELLPEGKQTLASVAIALEMNTGNFTRQGHRAWLVE